MDNQLNRLIFRQTSRKEELEEDSLFSPDFLIYHERTT